MLFALGHYPCVEKSTIARTICKFVAGGGALFAASGVVLQKILLPSGVNCLRKFFNEKMSICLGSFSTFGGVFYVDDCFW